MADEIPEYEVRGALRELYPYPDNVQLRVDMQRPPRRGRVRTVWVAVAACVLLVAGVSVVLALRNSAHTRSASPAPTGKGQQATTDPASAWFTLDAAQAAIALRAAHQIADSSMPIASGSPAPSIDPQPGWPANVSLVSYAGSTRAAANALLDGSTATINGVPDNRLVIVVRLVGAFSVITTGPAGSSGAGNGNVITNVLDASDGTDLDSGISTQADPAPLPNATIAYRAPGPAEKTSTKANHTDAFGLSSTQVAFALAAARAEAAGTIPSAPDGPPGQPVTLADGEWPDNITTVTYAVATRSQAETFMRSTPGTSENQVIVVRLVGQFSVQNGGPMESRGYSTGNAMTVLIDPSDGHLVEFGLNTEDDPGRQMPGAVVLFSR